MHPLIQKINNSYIVSNNHIFKTIDEAEAYLKKTLATKAAFDKANPYNYSRTINNFTQLQEEVEILKQLNP
jgi:hypothetical protein